MTIRAHLSRNLPVVADSWDRLRRTDVYRLLDSLQLVSSEDINAAAEIVCEHRPDLEAEAADCAQDLVNLHF